MNQLVKQNFEIEERLNKESSQAIIDGSIIVPDIKPDIVKVLEVTYDVSIKDYEPSNDRVSYKGELIVSVMYIGSDNEVHSMENVMAFDDFITVEEVTPRSRIYINCSVKDFNKKVVNDRKINYSTIVHIEVYGVNLVTRTYVTDIDSDNKNVSRKSINNIKTSKLSEIINIKDDIHIKSSSKNIGEILEANINISSIDVKHSGGRASISGEILASIIYKSEEDSIIEQIEKEIGFSGSIDSKTMDILNVDSRFDIDNKKVKIALDDDNEERIFTISCDLNCDIYLENIEEIEVLDNIHIPNFNVEIIEREQPFVNIISKNKNHYTLREVLAINEEDPNVLQIVSAKCDAIIDNVEVDEDSIVVQGVAVANVLYITKNDEEPIASHMWYVPFTQAIEAKGCNENMDVNTTLKVMETSTNILNDRELELKTVIMFNNEVLEIKHQRVIEDAVMYEMTKEEIEDIPSVVIHFVTQGETLWDLAKKYNTEIDDIVEMNNINNTDIIKKGEKLIIMKKVFYVKN